jgi:hypothetical protein
MHIQDSKSSGKDDSRLYIAGDKLHSNPLVLHSLPARFARLKNNPLLRVVRLNDTEAVVFKAMLSKAYDQDYGIRFAMLGNGRVEWALKFSWTDPYVYLCNTWKVFTDNPIDTDPADGFSQLGILSRSSLRRRERRHKWGVLMVFVYTR